MTEEEIEDASFDVTDKNTGRATTIPYADVGKVQGSGLSKGAKIGIIVGAAVVIVAVVIASGGLSSGVLLRPDTALSEESRRIQARNV